MMKILGFLACAVSLSLFSARYNAGWRRRAELICSLLDVVEHIRDRTAVFPDTQENIISEYAPKDAVGQAVKEALLAYYRTGEGEIIPKDLAPFADTADRERFLRFIKELGTGSLDDEARRIEQMHGYLSERRGQIIADCDKTKRLSLTLTACALGGLLMLVL